MKKIILPKGEGKTQQLINLSAKTRAHIICKDSTRAMIICNVASSQGKSIPTPVTFDDFIERQYYYRGVRGFLFDDIDLFIQYMAGPIPVVAITLSPENPDDPKAEDFDGHPKSTRR